ncbi:MAG TPA: cell division protein ZapA [Gammaproteobacteria bacterium]
MNAEVKQEQIRLLDKEYTVACPPEEREGLLESARLLDSKMRDIRGRGKIVGNERIVVMAALNIIFDLLQQQRGGDSNLHDTELRLKLLTEKLDAALAQEDRQLTL